MKSYAKSLIGLTLALPLVGCEEQKEAEPQRPNIVMFLVDDMGWVDTQVALGPERYPFNNRHYTPNMLRLAERSAIMTSAYVSPVSTPTRTSLMTGTHSAHTHITNWTAREFNSPSDASEQLDKLKNDVLAPCDWNVNGMAPSEAVENTFYGKPYPEVLREYGYYTIHVGKGHWGTYGNPAANPHNMGFCVNIAGQVAGKPRSYYSEDYYGNQSDKWDEFAVQNMCEYYGTGIHLTLALTFEAMKSLEYPIQEGLPFYLNFAHYAVHTPIHRDMRYFEKYRDMGMDEGQARFASMVQGVDDSLGRLMEYLEMKGVMDNTIIIFLSDNGGNSENLSKGGVRHTQNQPLREGKASCYEAGVRVPMMVFWPGKIAGGTRLNTPVFAEDIYPTILEMAGIRNYELPHMTDGKSLVKLLTEGSKVVRKEMDEGRITNLPQAFNFVIDEEISGLDPERPVISHFPHQWKPYPLNDIDYMSAIRKGDWKLVYRHRTQELELYNLREDIGERNNIADKHPAKVKELAKIISHRFRQWQTPMPYIRKTGKKVPLPDEII